MPELLNSLHCRNVKDLCFKHCCTRRGRAAPPPCPSPTFQGQTPHSHPNLQIQTNPVKQRLITAIPSPSREGTINEKYSGAGGTQGHLHCRSHFLQRTEMQGFERSDQTFTDSSLLGFCTPFPFYFLFKILFSSPDTA